MMKARFGKTDSIHIKNLIFNGNRPFYNLNFDWRVNKTIPMPTSTYCLIEECRFYQIPAENVFVCGATFRDCSGTDLNGSAIHFSCNSFDRPTDILYNKFSRSNQVGDSTMRHSEAGFTFSANVQNLRIAYNEMDQIEESGV